MARGIASGQFRERGIADGRRQKVCGKCDAGDQVVLPVLQAGSREARQTGEMPKDSGRFSDLILHI